MVKARRAEKKKQMADIETSNMPVEKRTWQSDGQAHFVPLLNLVFVLDLPFVYFSPK